MPLFDYSCRECGKSSEFLITRTSEDPECKFCGSINMEKLLCAPSSLSGTGKTKVPGLGDTTCCGSSPHAAGCAGPGSCCGKG
ncbi:zinc ribbon domain-containing protein [Desulfobacterales bacterium HSG17]|nr:zinc ribbon domain-containing protein [Desulfobacterales bacterium HSG17]